MERCYLIYYLLGASINTFLSGTQFNSMHLVFSKHTVSQYPTSGKFTIGIFKEMDESLFTKIFIAVLAKRVKY